MDDQRAFELIERREDLKNPAPNGLTRARDGFTRQDVVNAFAHAFTMIGGTQRLALWASANPDKFYALYSKLLPSTSIQIGHGGVVQIIHAIAPTPLDEHPEADVSSGGDDQV